MKKEDPSKFSRHFGKWQKSLDAAKCKTCEDLYKKVHAAIKKNPDRSKKAGNKKPTRKLIQKGFERVYQDSKNRKWLRQFRIDLDKRNQNIKEKFEAVTAKVN